MIVWAQSWDRIYAVSDSRTDGRALCGAKPDPRLVVPVDWDGRRRCTASLVNRFLVKRGGK